MNRYAVITQLFITLIVFSVCIASPALFDDLTHEGSLIEWLTAILFVAGGVVAGVSARKAGRRHAPSVTVWALALSTSSVAPPETGSEGPFDG